jgi:hypothetical protein
MARRARVGAEREDRLSIDFDQVLTTTAAAAPEVRRMLQGQVQLIKTQLAYRRQTEKNCKLKQSKLPCKLRV